MATYDKMTSLKNPGRSVQVESAIRDGSGKNIENNYAKQNGYYSTLKAGNADLADFADNITPYGPNSGVENNTPFVFQTSGGKSDIGSSAQIKKLEGASKAFNQLVQNGNFESSSNWFVQNGSLSVSNGVCSYTQKDLTVEYTRLSQKMIKTNIVNHKYLISFKVKHNANKSIKISHNYGYNTNFLNVEPNTWTNFEMIYTANFVQEYLSISIQNADNVGGVTDFITIDVKNVKLFDLTLMGLDNITTVEKFNRLFPLDYYPYDAGSIISSKVKGYKVVGYNAFDGIWLTDSSTNNLSDYIKVVGGQTYTLEYVIPTGTTMTFKIVKEYDASKNLLRTQYLHKEIEYSVESFELLENTQYIQLDIRRSAGSKPENVCLHLTRDGSRTGYEPYWSETYEFPNVELRAVNDVKDELLPDGTLTRRVGVVDLGTLNWAYASDVSCFRATTDISDIKQVSANNIVFNGICSKYKTTDFGTLTLNNIKAIALQANGKKVWIQDRDLGTDPTAFKTAMSGVYLIYELATPTTEQVNPYTENTLINNWGTQEWLSDNVVMLPQPATFFYSVDYKAFIDSVGNREDISYVAENIVSKEQLDDVVEGRRPVTLALASDNLTPYSKESGATETNPFVFQNAGGTADIGSQAYLRALRGNSVAFCQLLTGNGTNETINGITFTHNGDGTISVVGTTTATTNHYFDGPTGGLLANHKYLLKGCPAGGSENSYSLYCSGNLYDRGNGFIATITNNQTPSCRIEINNGITINNLTFRPQLFDLTLMGLDNITTVEEFNRIFPKPYYEYNAGELLSCKSNGYKTVGYNLFDGELEQGGTIQGQPINATDNVRSKNFIKVIGGKKYTFEESITSNKWKNRYVIQYDANKNWIKDGAFGNSVNGYGVAYSGTLENNCCYIKIKYYAEQTITPSDFYDICLHLTGSRTGYAPYESKTYPLPNVELRSAGNAYDELKPDGTLIRRIDVVDLGTLNWSYDSGQQMFFVLNFTQTPSVASTVKANIKCSIYTTNTRVALQNKEICMNDQSLVAIDTSYTDATAFKTAMSGVLLYYEKAEPTETTRTSYKFQELTDIDNFGTQEFLYDSDIDIPVPQGNEFFYPVDYKAFIDSLARRDDINYSADEIVSHAELTESETARDSIDTILQNAIGGTLRNCLAIKESLDFNNTAWVDISTLTWTKQTGYTASATGLESLLKKPTAYNVLMKALCTKYKVVIEESIATSDKSFAVSTSGVLLIKDTELDSLDATGIKNALKGVLLAYEKASS